MKTYILALIMFFVSVVYGQEIPFPRFYHFDEFDFDMSGKHIGNSVVVDVAIPEYELNQLKNVNPIFNTIDSMGIYIRLGNDLMDTIQFIRKQIGVSRIQKDTMNYNEFGMLYVQTFHRNVCMLERIPSCENLNVATVYSALSKHNRIVRHLLSKNTIACTGMLYTWRNSSNVHLYLEIENKRHFKRIYHVVL